MSIHVFAQYETLNFKHLTAKSGLPHEYLFYSIIQDSKGFMWFGSENGLHRYDGYEFTSFYHDPDDSSSISGNAVFHIMEDVDKNLWIASDKGVNRYNWNSNSFKHVPFLKSEDSLTNSDNCYSTYLLQVTNKNIYLSTNNYLYQYDTITNVFVPLSTMQNFPEVNRFLAIRNMSEDMNGNLWLSTQEKGLYLLDLKNKKIVEFSDKKELPYKLLSNNIFSVCIDSNNEVWVASDKGLNKINLKSMENRSFGQNLKNPSSSVYNFVNYVYEDDLKNLWISSDGGGLYLYDRKSDRLIHFKHNRDDQFSLLGDKTNLIYKNRQDQLWVASIGYGFSYTNLKNASRFNPPTNLVPDGKYHINRAVSAVVEDALGNLWVGTDGGGLVYYDVLKNKVTHYESQKNNTHSLPSNTITSLYIDKNKELWVGTFQGGLSKFNKSINSFTNYSSNPADSKSIAGYSVFAICEDKKGNILAGGHNSGINILNRKTNTVLHILSEPNKKNNLCSDYILTFYTDSQNEIWIGTYNGLSKWNQESNTFSNFYHNDFDKNSLSHNWVYAITEDSKNNLWVGTASGLNLFDRKTKKFTSISKKDGFVNHVINGIIEDKEGNLWLSTNGGLVIFNPETKKVRNLDISDGLPGNEFMKCAYYKGKNDVFYFGNTKGLVYLLPDSIKTNTAIPPVYITDFFIQNNLMPINAKGSPLQKQIIETKEIVLNYDQTYITFKYTALNYESPEKNQYAYKLEGFDKDWHYVGNERKATYTSLDAGEYIFRVKATNNDGIWNEEGTSLKIVVLPPWWKTWWFNSLLVFSVIALFFAIYYYRVSTLHRQKQELELKVVKRTEELNIINKRLEKQSEELLLHTENLKKTNDLLIEKQELIEAQKEVLLLSNEQLSILNATKDKLFSVLGHDLKTPFNALLGFGELLIENIHNFSRDEIKEIIVRMNEGVVITYEMLENLLNWARSQRGAVKLNATDIYIRQMLNNTLKILQQQAEAKNIKLNNIFEGNKEVIFIDEVILSTIIRNIVSNSIKFSHKNSQIEIKTLIMENLVQFSISDQGVGMPITIKENLFKVNSMISKQGTGGEKGTGLGLLVCAEFVNLLNGKIWVESELNVGTTFFIEIPI